MNAPRTCAHRQIELPVTTLSACTGEPVDMGLAWPLLSAALDGCRPCQEVLTNAVLDAPPEIIAVLAGTAFVSLELIIQSTLASLGGRLAGVAKPSAAGTLAPATREVFRLMEADDPAGAEGRLKAMPREERQDVLEDALTHLVGVAPA